MSGRFGTADALRWGTVLVLAALASLPARADTLDSFISDYAKIEHAAPPNTLPVAAADLKASKGLFNCLADGKVDPVVCVDKFHDTPLGKKASNEAGIPSSFWQGVDAYIAYREHDYWGVAYHLGAAATCAVVQVLLGGADACAIVAEIVELAKDVYAGGKQVAEFFADVGETGYGAAKGAYCASLGQVFGGCGGGSAPKKPKSQLAYEKFFAPRLKPDGLIAIESEDLWALAKLVDAISTKAKAQGYAAGDIQTAAGVFDKALDTVWSEHMAQVVMPELIKERQQFNIAGSIHLAAADAWSRYKGDTKKLPSSSVPLYCNQRFSTLGYSHVTRWVNAHAGQAAALKLDTLFNWCKYTFWQANQSAFAQAFRDAKLVGSICPHLGCPSQQAHALCKPFMSTVGQSCGLVASIAGTPAMNVAPSKVDPLPRFNASPARAGHEPPKLDVSPVRSPLQLPVAQVPNAQLRRDLASLSCSERDGELRFVCATSMGFERCEALRARRLVAACRPLRR